MSTANECDTPIRAMVCKRGIVMLMSTRMTREWARTDMQMTWEWYANSRKATWKRVLYANEEHDMQMRSTTCKWAPRTAANEHFVNEVVAINKWGLRYAKEDCTMQIRTAICKWASVQTVPKGAGRYANDMQTRKYIYIYHLLTKGRRGLCKWEVCKRAGDWIMTFWDSEVHFWGWKCQFWVWKSHFWVWKCHFGFHLFGAESAILCINFGVSIWGFLVPHFGAENTIFEGLKSHFGAKNALFFLNQGPHFWGWKSQFRDLGTPF